MKEWPDEVLRLINLEDWYQRIFPNTDSWDDFSWFNVGGHQRRKREPDGRLILLLSFSFFFFLPIFENWAKVGQWSRLRAWWFWPLFFWSTTWCGRSGTVSRLARFGVHWLPKLRKRNSSHTKKLSMKLFNNGPKKITDPFLALALHLENLRT